MKAVSSSIGGFTPLIDAVVADVGTTQALVFGSVWRRCQMSDGVCHASIQTLADSMDMSTRTVLRHIKELCEAGYLEDTTPELRNRPHTYRDTGKVKISVSVQAGVTESHSGMTESHSHYDRESHEETIQDTIKETKNREDSADAPSPASQILEAWIELFPNKPKHRLTDKLKRQAVTRMKSKDFATDWRKSLEHAAKSVVCLEGDWFNLYWFLKNDDGWREILLGKYDFKNEHKKSERIRITS